MADSLNLMETALLSASYKSKGTPCPACPSRSADTMDIVFVILRDIIINDGLHVIHIYTSCRYIRCNQYISAAVTETVHGHVSLMLGHITMEPLCLKTCLFQHLRKLVHLSLGITENQTQLGLIILQQSHTCRILVLAFNLIVSLGHQRNGQFFCSNLYHSCVVLKLIGNL